MWQRLRQLLELIRFSHTVALDVFFERSTRVSAAGQQPSSDPIKHGMQDTLAAF